MDKVRREGLMNVVNVLARISDELFIREYWNGITSNYDSLVIDYSEAIEILNSFGFFDLELDTENFWKGDLSLFNKQTLELLIEIAKRLDDYEDYDQTPEEFLSDPQWREIMKLSSKAITMLKEDLKILNDEEFLR